MSSPFVEGETSKISQLTRSLKLHILHLGPVVKKTKGKDSWNANRTVTGVLVDGEMDSLVQPAKKTQYQLNKERGGCEGGYISSKDSLNTKRITGGVGRC